MSATTIKIKLLLFASARELAGDVTSTTIELSSPEEHNTKILRNKIAEKYPKLSTLVTDEDHITLALNEEYIPSGETKELKDGDTVALIPPISGG